MRRARTGRRREKVFGPGRAIPLDPKAKARIRMRFTEMVSSSNDHVEFSDRPCPGFP